MLFYSRKVCSTSSTHKYGLASIFEDKERRKKKTPFAKAGKTQ